MIFLRLTKLKLDSIKMYTEIISTSSNAAPASAYTSLKSFVVFVVLFKKLSVSSDLKFRV